MSPFPDAFDPYAGSYREHVRSAIGFVSRDCDLFTEVKAAHLLASAARRLGPTRGLAALDVGCGPGETDRFLDGVFGDLHGVDVSAAMIETARERNPSVRYAVSEAGTLPYPDERFDLAFAICVLHHVEPASRPTLVREMVRVVRPGGLLAVYEHNPLNPLTRLAVARCEFDRDAILLPPGEMRRAWRTAGAVPLGRRYLLFLPWRGGLLRRLERALAWSPLGAQYASFAARPR